MDTYDWNDYSGSKLKRVVDHLIKGPLTNLLSLSKDQCLLTEIAIFRKNLEKIRVRLRNSKISSLLKKLRRLIHLYLDLNIPEILEKECLAFLSEKYNGNKQIIELPKGESVITVRRELRNLADILDNICKYSSYSLSHCMLWLRLGHMIPHFVVCLSTISRLNVICRALLIYVADLYSGLSEFCQLCKNNEYLEKSELGITEGPLKDLVNKNLDNLEEEGEDILMIEDIGQVLSRDDEIIKNILSPQTTEDSNEVEKFANLSEISGKLKRRRIASHSVGKYTSFGVLHKLTKRKRLRSSFAKVKSKVDISLRKMGFE